ncbi:MAG TPA: serine hydrolase domain-containing protein, partial [Isosphaeraceae bacterium]|nr:serine hydrolase domain-containing protein [Isosphaeraceae bacterium]
MAAGTPPTAAYVAARIGPIVQQYMTQEQIPGMAVAVTYRGRVVLTKGYGMADLSTGAPVTPKTQFSVGSVTKAFTGEAVLLLAQRPSLIKEPGIKSLNLDAPIGNYLRDQGGFHLPATWANLTTRELLNMSSGIPFPESDPPIPWYDVINASAPNDLAFQPGTQFLYSNTNTWLAGELVSQLSGQTYEQFVTDHLLHPLGMSRTTFLGPDPLLPGQATGYELSQGRL